MKGVEGHLKMRDSYYKFVRQEAADRTLFSPAPWFKQLIADLKRHEGFYEYAYPDPLSPLAKRYPIAKYWGTRPAREVLQELGQKESLGRPWTNGYGFTRGVTIDSHIARIKADRMIEQEALEHMVGAEMLWPNWKQAPAVIQSVFANLLYNLGLAKLSNFTTTLNLLKAGKYAAAGHNLKKTLWYKQVGVRGEELTERLITGRIRPEHQYKD